MSSKRMRKERAALSKVPMHRDHLSIPAKVRKNTYYGPQAEGHQAFHAGLPITANPYHFVRLEPGEGSKAQRWHSGWTKAKLAKQQGKARL